MDTNFLAKCILFCTGIFMIGYFISYKMKITRCRMEVEAILKGYKKCNIGSSFNDHPDGPSYSPILEAYIDGQYITYSSNFYSHEKLKEEIGEKVTIYVNPDNINEWYCEQRNEANLLWLFIGIFVTGFSIMIPL